MGQVAEAQAAYARALLLKPDLSIARYQLGLLQYLAGQLAMALLTWQPLMAADADSYLNLFVKGFALLSDDRFQDAAAMFEAGMHANGENSPLNADIALLLSRLPATVSDKGHEQPATQATVEIAHVLLAGYRHSGSIN